MTDSDNIAPLGTPDNPLDNSVINAIFDGRLLTEDYLSAELITLSNSGITAHRLDDDKVEQLYNKMKAILDEKLSDDLSEVNTNEFIIFPILKLLGWENYTREYHLPSGNGKKFGFYADALLFLDDRHEKEKSGLIIVENKRPSTPLDNGYDHFSAPAIQILGYLRHASVVSDGKIKWGILTNGKEWRLYYQNAQSISEEFFSVHLDSLFSLEKKEEALACFKIFLLMLAKQSFLPAGIENKSFHLFALEDVKLHQQRITDKMAEKIFTETYEKLAKAIATQAKDASPEEIKISTLKFLFRILFIMFAEDRDLLPINQNAKYLELSLRYKIRAEISQNIAMSDNTTEYWNVIKGLCNIINNGDELCGVPKYNGGLFEDDKASLLTKIEINDKELAEIIRPLSHLGEAYINYKNLNVEQLGAIYEQLLEREIVKQEGKSEIVVSAYARKNSGSYYTPQELVNLVIAETIEPLFEKHMDAFYESAGKDNSTKTAKELGTFDPAKMILSQKICDPSMGSGHFLVSLTDRLTDQVISAMAQAEKFVNDFELEYKSPVRQDIEEIRATILQNSKQGEYAVNEAHLKDRHIIKRMVLKKCIYGVDKNPMATELAKLALWLHTFTVGAPLSFLDHHLKCGDSLFGLRLVELNKKIGEAGLFLGDDIEKLIDETGKQMEKIGNLTDAEISQVEESVKLYEEAQVKINPMRKLLSFLHAIDWLHDKKRGQEEQKLKSIPVRILGGEFGDPTQILTDSSHITPDNKERDFAIKLIHEAEDLIKEENFFHWQIEFPEVWEMKNGKAEGGFDAVVGNPPWDRIKLQEIEWFADRDFAIASSTTQAKRKAGIKKLKTTNPSLYKKYEDAKWRAKVSLDILRTSGIYEELNKGDVNIYKIFLERSRQIVSDAGYASLVMPSGIATDQQSSTFFKELVKNKQLISFYDFENGRMRYNRGLSNNQKLKPFFKDVHKSFKFCVLTQTKFSNENDIKYSVFIQQMEDIDNPEKAFPMTPEDFNLVNPNTGTAPLLINNRDKKLVISAYKKHLVLEKTASINHQSKWDVRQLRMFDATNDSNLFKDEKDLQELQAYPVGNDNCYKNKDGVYLPLYRGRMLNLHDHRAASTINNPDNLFRPNQTEPTSLEQHQDANYYPKTFHWVLESERNERTAGLEQDWSVAFRNITASTNERTFVACILPKVACENTVIILINKKKDKKEFLLHANFCSIPFDYITRNKIHATSLNWFIVQQLPVIDVDVYDKKKFGKETAEEIIKEIILELNYTAYDLKAFAEDLGYEGEPFKWDEHRRLSLMAKLDAIYFILYGITGDEDIDYIYKTFPITQKHQEEAYGEYKTLKLCIDYKNALLNGEADIVY